MNDYIQVDHGRIVVGDVLEKPERHLTLVASDNWPTEADTDPYERSRNPVGPAVVLSLIALVVYIGVVGWVVFY